MAVAAAKGDGEEAVAAPGDGEEAATAVGKEEVRLALLRTAASSRVDPRVSPRGGIHAWVRVGRGGLTGLAQTQPCLPNGTLGNFWGFNPLEEFPPNSRPTPAYQTRP